MTSRLRFALSRLGVKPGARDALAVLLDAPDIESTLSALPGTTADPQRWRRLDQRTWRTGAVTDPQPWQVDARAAGSLTAWRSLAARPRPQWLWLQWLPLASTAGAADALVAAADPALGLRNLGATVEQVDRRTMQPPPAVAGADRVSATEERTTGPDPVLTLRCTVGRHLLLLCGSGDGWGWPSLTSLAELQLRRLSTAADPPGPSGT